MIESWKIKELNSTPIEMIAERLGLRVERHKSRCPWHDDRHPSLSFDVRRNRYRCYVCDAHGGVIDMVMGLRHCGFVEACAWLGGDEAIGRGGGEAIRRLGNEATSDVVECCTLNQVARGYHYRAAVRSVCPYLVAYS